jgi:uncharacterized membrane protein
VRPELVGLRERASGSLFLVPMAFVLAGTALAIALLAVDDALSDDVTLPITVASTAESARSVLSTVASATMAFAGIAFSVALLVVQMSSSQYSPRVIHGLFRDRFNKRVMGVVVGTFAYCLVVLRSVHGPLDSGADAAVPTVSVTAAVLLGIVTVLAVVAFIDHNAHRMDVSEILRDVTDSTKQRVEATWPAAGPDLGEPLPPDVPTGSGDPVRALRDGWVQTVDTDALLDALAPGGTLRVDTAPGRYVVSETLIAALWPPPADPDETRRAVNRAIVVGNTRTLTEDPAYGLRQLVDVALRALSPGVNDPTTAQDAILHLAAVLRGMLERDPRPQAESGTEGRRVLLPELSSHRDLIELSFAELRRAAAPHPAVVVYLLEAIRLAGDGLDTQGRRGAPLLDALRAQAHLVLAEAERADLAPWDLEDVRRHHDRRFGHGSDGTGRPGRHPPDTTGGSA